MKCTLRILAAVFYCISADVFAGNLEPSSAPGSTMKPLDQVEPRIAITSLPYTISASGSYYLTQNLTAVNSGITLSADDATIDLRGFTIAGSGGANSIGIIFNGKRNVEVRNGTITNFSQALNDTVTSTGGVRIINLRVVANQSGICMSNSHSLVKDCTVTSNGASAASTVYGISVGNNSSVIGNIIGNNGISATGQVYAIFIVSGMVSGNCVSNNGNLATNYVYGIDAGQGCAVISNTVNGNGSLTAPNSYGVYTGNQCTVCSNTVRSNLGTGITTGDHCSITDNTTSSNAYNGINAGYYCTISNCVANLNTQRGIYANDYSMVTNSTASQNSQDGIWVMSYCTVTGSNAGNNQKIGIFCWRGKVMGNTVGNNNQAGDATGAGIQVWYGSQVRDNMAMDNKVNNFYIHDLGSSIENNALHGSTNGINFASGSGNYFNNNRADNVTTPWANVGTNVNGGGNVSF